MAKQSQLDKALAALKGERDILNLAIAKLEAQQQGAKTATPRKSRRREATTEPHGQTNGE